MEEGLVPEAITFEAAGLRLSGLLEYAEDTTGERGALLLSPHPHFAGDMHNNVVRALSRGLARAGLIVLRFDYHGIGDSQAPPLKDSIFDHWREIEEGSLYERPLADARGALAHLRSLLPADARIPIVGYSFGGLMAWLLREDLESIHPVIAIAPPTARLPALPPVTGGAHVHLIQGLEDFVHDPDSLAREKERLGDHLEVHLLDGEDHFFRGREVGLVEHVRSVLEVESEGPRNPLP